MILQLSRTRSGGLLRNLVSAVRDARSSRTDSDQLETANAQDSDSRRQTRQEASQGVLGDRAFAGMNDFLINKSEHL